MKKYYLIFGLLCYILQSCDFDEQGGASLNGFGWFLIIVFIFFFAIIIIDGNKKHAKSEKQLAEMGLNFSDFKNLGMYVGGHPSLNESIKNVYALKEKDKIVLYTQVIAGYEMPKLVPNSDIDIDSIKDIKLEDASSIENKITLGRLLLVGIFAFAWKKKKKNEIAFVTVTWSKGKFEQNTTFMFEGKDALQNANTARNQLMEICM